MSSFKTWKYQQKKVVFFKAAKEGYYETWKYQQKKVVMREKDGIKIVLKSCNTSKMDSCPHTCISSLDGTAASAEA